MCTTDGHGLKTESAIKVALAIRVTSASFHHHRFLPSLNMNPILYYKLVTEH